MNAASDACPLPMHTTPTQCTHAKHAPQCIRPPTPAFHTPPLLLALTRPSFATHQTHQHPNSHCAQHVVDAAKSPLELRPNRSIQQTQVWSCCCGSIAPAVVADVCRQGQHKGMVSVQQLLLVVGHLFCVGVGVGGAKALVYACMRLGGVKVQSVNATAA